LTAVSLNLTVVVLGSINMDLVVRAPHLPRPGETLHGSDFLTVGGGKGANQATAAARLGASVQFIGAVGADDFGARRLAEMTTDGIDVSRIVRLKDSPTGVALITVDSAGENTIVIAAGANMAVTPEAVAAFDFSSAPGGLCVAQLELPLKTVAAGLRAAKSAGLVTMLNVAPYKPEARDLLRDVDILIANEGEASDLAGWQGVVSRERAAEVATKLRAYGPTTVIVTLGAAGAVVVTATRTVHVPAPSVQAIDATGAGDCFTGALAAGLAAGEAIETAAQRAVAAASYSTTVVGATPGMPTIAQLDAFLASTSA